MSEKLINAIADLHGDEALALVKQMLDSGDNQGKILDCIRKAMEIVGARFEKQEYFLPELLMSGQIMNNVKELFESRQDVNKKRVYKGTIVLGTVKGDIHNIGKDIVGFLLDTNGYEVIDLGVDVPADKFAEAVKNHNPQVLGLSAFLTPAFDEMKKTITVLNDEGLRTNLKIMIGGGQMNDQVCEYTGADKFGVNAMDAVNIANNWIGG